MSGRELTDLWIAEYENYTRRSAMIELDEDQLTDLVDAAMIVLLEQCKKADHPKIRMIQAIQELQRFNEYWERFGTRPDVEHKRPGERYLP